VPWSATTGFTEQRLNPLRLGAQGITAPGCRWTRCGRWPRGWSRR